MHKESDNFRIGIDIGGTAVKALALSSEGTIAQQVEFPSHTGDGEPQEFLEVLDRGLAPLFKLGPCEFIGVGCAGSIDSAKGLVRSSPNFQRWQNVPLGKWIEERFEVPTAIDNDANCAVLADWKMGAAKGANHVILLTLGTGVGGGIIVNNQLLRGATGTAAELGHLTIVADGEPCPCGNRGCLERYCSASALKRICPNHSPKEIFKRAAQGEPQFVKICQDFIHKLSVGIVSIANTFDPDFLVLGGGIAESVLAYTEDIHKELRQHAFAAPANHMQIVGAKWGNLSGALGASQLA